MSTSVQALSKELFATLPSMFHFIRRTMYEIDIPLPRQQLHVLKLVRTSAVSVGEIATAMRMSTPTASTMIDALVQKKYLKRERSKEDRRKIQISITSQGIALLQQAEQAIIKELNTVFEHTTAAEREQLSQALQLLQQSFQPYEQHDPN